MEIRNFLEYNRNGRTSVEDCFAYRLLEEPLYGYFIHLFACHLLISYKRVKTLNFSAIYLVSLLRTNLRTKVSDLIFKNPRLFTVFLLTRR